LFYTCASLVAQVLFIWILKTRHQTFDDGSQHFAIGVSDVSFFLCPDGNLTEKDKRGKQKKEIISVKMEQIQKRLVILNMYGDKIPKLKDLS